MVLARDPAASDGFAADPEVIRFNNSGLSSSLDDRRREIYLFRFVSIRREVGAMFIPMRR
jgi:hypothetical protein